MPSRPPELDAFEARLELLRGTVQSALPQPSIASRTIWVNPAIGSDNNDGSANNAAHAMKTIAGANLRQVGMGRRPNLDGQAVVVMYVGATCAEDVFVDAFLGSNGTYQLNFVPTFVRSGTITASHFPLAAFTPGEDQTITDGAGLVWGPYLASNGFRVDFTSGPAAGCSSFVMKDLGGGVARVTSPTFWPGPGGTTFVGGNAFPVGPCTYNIVQLTHMTGAIVDVSAGNLANPNVVVWPGVQVLNVNADVYLPLAQRSVIVNSYAGIYGVYGGTATAPIGSVFGFYYASGGATVTPFSGGLLNAIMFVSGSTSWDETPILQGCNLADLQGSQAYGAFEAHERAGIFDLASPLIVRNGFQFTVGPNGLFGNGSTSAIFQINTGGQLAMNGTPVLATTTSAPVEVVWGTGAGGTVSQARPYTPSTDTLGALTTTTFANIAAAIGGGGFGYNAQRNNGARIAQL